MGNVYADFYAGKEATAFEWLQSFKFDARI